MSDQPMREMNLIELITSLPKTHIARKEHTKLLGRLSKEKNERLRLEQEVKELQGSIRVLEVMLKPDGYTTDEEHYHTPEDYIDSLLTKDSKVGEQFTITPYTLLPEETYEITKLDDDSFEIELVELNKESK